MNQIIQQIYLNDEHSLYLIDFNKLTSELTFRTSRIPEHRQIEKITTSGDFICTNLYKFHVNYLHKFLQENEQGLER